MRVLLTGADNLIGSHVLDQLLSDQVAVRAVVGTREQAQSLQQQYPQAAASLLDFAIVSSRDGAMPGAYDDALNGYTEPFDAVIHALVADPSEEADCLSRFINLESENLINFVRSVKEVATSVRRVILITTLTPFARWLVDPQVDRVSRSGDPSIRRVQEIDSEYVLATSQASDNIVEMGTRCSCPVRSCLYHSSECLRSFVKATRKLVRPRRGEPEDMEYLLIRC
jgi:KaiC/GvpD/RAD55 family RecA-like ATPase